MADTRPVTTVVERLRAAGCVFAEEEAALLLAAGGGELVDRRVAGEPLEQVLGWVDFCGVRVLLDPGVFVPRQRSALLVRTAAALAPRLAVDLGCGSGGLGLALRHLVPGVEVHATDLDPVAVACARRNLAHVWAGDLFDGLPGALRGRVDVVLANVPYVPTGALPDLPREARDHEPRLALDGGADGLDVLRRAAAAAPDWLAAGGTLLSEVSPRQLAEALDALEAAGLRATSVEADDTAVVLGRG